MQENPHKDVRIEKKILPISYSDEALMRMGIDNPIAEGFTPDGFGTGWIYTRGLDTVTRDRESGEAVDDGE